MNQFALPDVGEGLTEAELVAWRVAVGDTVAVNDVLCDIETAKSIVELPSPYAGTVTALLVAEGETVPVGTPIITIGTAAEPAESSAPGAGDVVAEAPAAEKREPTLVGYGARTSSPRRRQKAPVDLGRVVPLHAAHDDPAHRHVRAKPPVRKLAKDLGIDLADVPASGPIVTRKDVEAYAAAQSVVAEPLAQPPMSAEPAPARTSGPVFAPSSSGDVRLPVKGVRKAMAEAMTRTMRTSPQATEWLTLDVSRTVELVERLRADRAFDGVRVTPTVIVAKAVCLAMRHTPILNAHWIEATDDGVGDEILLRGAINLGIAVATDRGLMVPHIKSAEQLSMVDLAREIDRATATAREGRTPPEDQVGGTFTITNIGVLGVDAGTPILNPGESAILAVGAIQRRPWVDADDAIVPRWVTTLAVSFDHRLADGADASRFLTDVADILRDPATALTY